jgi:quercetin dioxygenase-like cupin family protein
MFGKKAALLALLTAGLVLGVIAVASGSAPSGFTTVQIARGQSDRNFAVVQFKGNDIVTAQNTINPGGFTGWHSHPGVAVIAVQAGQVTLYSEPVGGGKCSVDTFSAGQVFLERPNDEENAVNTGGVPEVAGITFFNVPHGGAARIDRPDPGDCPG